MRKFLKQEKRIIKLLYRKGVIDDMCLKPRQLYWACYTSAGKKEKGKYKFDIYMPELHYCETDYWGEADEYSIVYRIRESLVYSSYPSDDIEECELAGLGPSYKYKGRENLIRYLKTFPTKKSDSKINSCLKIVDEEDYMKLTRKKRKIVKRRRSRRVICEKALVCEEKECIHKVVHNCHYYSNSCPKTDVKNMCIKERVFEIDIRLKKYKMISYVS